MRRFSGEERSHGSPNLCFSVNGTGASNPRFASGARMMSGKEVPRSGS